MTPPVPDGPDTELAAIVADLDDLHTEACSVAMRSEGSVTAAAEEVRDDVASIRDRLRAVLARPAAGRDLTAQDVYDALGESDVFREGYTSVVDRLNGIARPAVARTDGQPDPDPHGRYDVPDAYDHPGWPLVSRIVAIATDTAPTMPNETDGVDNAVTGLLADQSWRDHVAMADVMGLVGDWGTDDVVQAVTDALHEYPRLRARVARTDGQPPADDPSVWILIEQINGWADALARGYLRVGPIVGQMKAVVEQYRHVQPPRQPVVEPTAPADDTAVQGWGDVESADFIERARAATAVGSFTAQFDHVYDPSGDFVCESVDHSTAVRIAAALSGAPAHDTAAPDLPTLRCDRCDATAGLGYPPMGEPFVYFVRPGLCHPCLLADNGQPVRDSQGHES